MKTKTLLSSISIAGVIILASSFSSIANAAQGCGYGYHRVGYYGRCVLNHPGPYARPINHRCWRNVYGHVRCYR